MKKHQSFFSRGLGNAYLSSVKHMIRAELSMLAPLPEISTSTSILAPDRQNPANDLISYFSGSHHDLGMCRKYCLNWLAAAHIPHIISSYPVGGTVRLAEKQTGLLERRHVVSWSFDSELSI